MSWIIPQYLPVWRKIFRISNLSFLWPLTLEISKPNSGLLKNRTICIRAPPSHLALKLTLAEYNLAFIRTLHSPKVKEKWCKSYFLNFYTKSLELHKFIPRKKVSYKCREITYIIVKFNFLGLNSLPSLNKYWVLLSKLTRK